MPALQRSVGAGQADLASDVCPCNDRVAARCIQDARARANYVSEAQRSWAELRDQAARGALSVEKAAVQAVDMRNGLLDAARLQKGDIARDLRGGE